MILALVCCLDFLQKQAVSLSSDKKEKQISSAPGELSRPPALQDGPSRALVSAEGPVWPAPVWPPDRQGHGPSAAWLQEEATAHPYHVSCFISILLHIKRKNSGKRRLRNLNVERRVHRLARDTGDLADDQQALRCGPSRGLLQVSVASPPVNSPAHCSPKAQFGSRLSLFICLCTRLAEHLLCAERPRGRQARSERRVLERSVRVGGRVDVCARGWGAFLRGDI